MKKDRSRVADPRDYAVEHGAGGMSRWAFDSDPKRLCFHLARYKHVAKMLAGFENVLEVGCADGFGTRIVRQHVGALTAIDTDERSVQEARLASSPCWPVMFERGDICDVRLDAPELLGGPAHSVGAHRWRGYDAVYSLDVLEHISPDAEFLFAMSAAAPVAVIGTPSKESQQYASPLSRLGHVNCYSGEDLRRRLLEFWDHVFLFTMHDEVLGTSYYPMAQYLLALCVRWQLK